MSYILIPTWVSEITKLALNGTQTVKGCPLVFRDNYHCNKTHPWAVRN